MTLDRTVAPVIHDAVDFDFKLPPINTVDLSNGLKMHWIDAGVQELVQVDWVFPGGLWYEGKTSVAQTTAALLKNGTGSRSAAAISDALEFYGAELKTSASSEFATISLYALSKHLPALLPVVYELITDSVFPEEELDIYKKNAIQKLSVNLRNCDFVANRLIDQALYGYENPYGRFTRKEDIESLNRQDLLGFYKSAYNPARMRIFVAGRVTGQVIKQISDCFGGIAISPAEPVSRSYDIVPSADQKQHVSNDPNGVQGAIRIGRLFPNRRHPDFAPMVVLNTLFGGYFGSRLMSNIREEKGYTYGIYSSLTPERNGGTLTVHTETGREVVEEAIKEIYHEMDVLRNEPADDEELLLVKNYLLGGMLADLDGPFSILRRWRTLILNDFTEAHFYNNINVYKNITAAELQALACKYLDPKDFHEIVVI